MPIIRLYDLDGIGLIISYASGVLYSNQTGGYLCSQPEIEGVFAPLNNRLTDQQTKLNDFFTGSKWGGNCYDGIDKETADFVDLVLLESDQTEMLRVDRDKLAESHEAWIHVHILESKKNPDLQDIHGFAGSHGVLTWLNSD